MNILNSVRSLFKYNTNIVILTLFQWGISIQMSISDNWNISYTVFNVVFSSLSLIVLFGLTNTLFSLTGKKRGLVFNLMVTGLYIGLQSYHIIRHESLSFLLIYKNGRDLLHVEGLKFVLGNITVIGWGVMAIGVGAIAVFQMKLKLFNTFYKPQNVFRTLAVLIVCNIMLLVSVSVSVSGSSNEYTAFFTSAYRYFNPAEIVTFDSFEGRGQYPYLKTVNKTDERLITNDTTKPHVFIVMLESFSSYYMERVENGKKVTPFIDSLKDHGVYVKDFFSVSMETSKGQFATLCSVYPSFRTNVFTRYYKNNYNCLSHILKENGYTNVFLKAYHDLDFENTGTFVSNIAFDYSHGMDKNFVTAEERKQFKLGWGIQDDIFYKKTFEYLDTLKKKVSKPFFVTTMSVTNHMMFDKIPDEQEYVFPGARSHHENYTNSMHLTDKYLREFFKQLDAREYLKNSLVIVIGDNGFPMGQHRNNYHNTKTAYNEIFKMPMLVLWNGKLAPAVLEESAYSQLDVAPTVMELLGIKMTNHFVGTSIFASRPDDYFVPLVQPFDGTVLASIRYPFKLIKYHRDGNEEFYDLKKDKGEKYNAISSYRDSKIVKEMRKDIDKIRYNELLLKEDRIFSR